jgi:hypothetical protein
VLLPRAGARRHLPGLRAARELNIQNGNRSLDVDDVRHLEPWWHAMRIQQQDMPLGLRSSTVCRIRSRLDLPVPAAQRQGLEVVDMI